MQSALDGHPLYYFTSDTQPGDVTGQGVMDFFTAAPVSSQPVLGMGTTSGTPCETTTRVTTLRSPSPSRPGCRCSSPQRFLPLKNGIAAACFIHDANWRSSSSPTDAGSTPRRLTHPSRSHRRLRLEVGAANEHHLHVAEEGPRREAPAPADAVVRHAPLHRALKPRQRLRRQGIDRSAMPRCGCGKVAM